MDIYIENINELNPFKYLIKYFNEFEFNNIYQKLYEDIVVLLTNKFTPQKILENFLIENEFFDNLINNTINQYLFTYSSGKTITSGNFAIKSNILKSIVNSENSYIKENIEKGEKLFYKFFLIKFSFKNIKILKSL